MAEYVHLIGAEDVRRAASEMSHAASVMQQAASSFAHTMEMHQRFMDDWLQRLNDTLEAGRAALSDTKEAPHGQD